MPEGGREPLYRVRPRRVSRGLLGALLGPEAWVHRVRMQVKPLAAGLVQASSTMRSTKRHTLLTILSLASDDWELRHRCLQLIDQGAARIDEELVFALHSAGDRKVKLALASSLAVSRMRPRSFRKIFDEAYRRPDLTVVERRELVWNLEVFLIQRPRQLRVYERIILDLLESPHPDLRVRALSMVGRMDPLAPSTLDLLGRNLESRTPSLRVNALEGFHELIERLDRLDSHVRSFVSSATFLERVTHLRRTDPDASVRHNARAVLKVLTRVGSGRSRSRRKPPR